MARSLAERGMTPLVTLHHFSDPIWLAEMGGWENEKAVGYFVAFVRKVVEALQEYVNLWVTINEPNGLCVHGYLEGVFPPGKKDTKAYLRALTNLARAHALAYHAIHTVQPTARVGLSIYYRDLVPAKPSSPLDRFAAGLVLQNVQRFLPTRCTGRQCCGFPSGAADCQKPKAPRIFSG